MIIRTYKDLLRAVRTHTRIKDKVMKIEDFDLINDFASDAIAQFDELPTDEVINRYDLQCLLVVFYVQAYRSKAIGVDYPSGLSFVLSEHGMSCIITGQRKQAVIAPRSAPYFCELTSLSDDLLGILDAIQQSYFKATNL